MMSIKDFFAACRPYLAKGPIVAVILILGIGYLLGVLFGPNATSTNGSMNQSTVMETSHTGHEQMEPTMWTCSMHPQIRSDKPGKCPICGMDLIPVAKTATGGMRTISLSPAAQALMNIDVSPVQRRYVMNEIPMVGKVDYDETKLGYITAWVAGRLDRLYVDYSGVEVKKGDHMVYIYSEPLYSAQEELIQALKYSRQRTGDTARFGVPDVNLLESAREKLRLLGLNEDQIKEIESRGTPDDHVTIYSPVSGVVIEKLKQEGERVAVGERIYTVADLGLVWVHLDAYESDLPWIRYGQDVTITTEAYPGEEFHGRVAFIQPVLNDKTRTVKVRVNVPNPDGKLKPEMFVHAVVRPTVAAGGRVMDPSLVGKWICPMHPEIVKDESGTCDICGMQLVRAESLGYVTPQSDVQEPPLVIPNLAALVTGTRGIVYVELPAMHSAAEPAFQTLSSVVSGDNLDKSREAFAVYARMLEQPYDQPGTAYAKQVWNEFADRLAEVALVGERASSNSDAKSALAQIESTMNEVREEFAPPGKPTYEGREIVLGPRAGDYYLLRHGLQEGELVVTQGNFKIDAEIQIQAKPSMMTPEGGGGGGGHHHGGGAMPKTNDAEQAAHPAALPAEFAEQVRQLEPIYEEIVEAIRQQDFKEAASAFTRFGKVLNRIDASSLSGHPHMLWKELTMLLGNDVVEGSSANQLAAADRVFLLLKGHMRRLREQFGLTPVKEKHEEHFAVNKEFQLDLASVWEQYRAIGEALAADKYDEARNIIPLLRSALDTVDAQSLGTDAKQRWHTEQTNLDKDLDQLEQAPDIKEMRSEFAALSSQVGTVARVFGFGADQPIYELHCPMALQGKGAVWYQQNDTVHNPYFGTAMLSCADRVEQITPPTAQMPAQHEVHEGHTQH